MDMYEVIICDYDNVLQILSRLNFWKCEVQIFWFKNQ